MMKFAKSLSRLLLASLVAVSLSALGTPAFAQEKTDDLTNNPFLRLLGTPAESAWTADKLERQYDEVWTEISDHYFDRAALSNWLAWRHKFDGKMKTLADLDNALDEMVSSLDNRWTTYVGKQTSSAMTESFENNIALGIWASKVEDGSYQVYYLEYGSPAYGSSLRKGDRITAINGKKLSALPTLEVQGLFVGKAGEKRELTFTHDGVTEKTSFTISAYPDKEYEIVLRDDHVLYLRLPAFSPSNTATFKEELLAVFENANVKVEKIVLDLRGNLGGYTTEVKPIASLFIDQGLVYSLRFRDGRETSLETKRIEPPLPFELTNLTDVEKRQRAALLSAPMVILVNSSTGSSAEILTQALVSNKRAVSMGDRTMGKSLAYADEQLNNGGMLRLAKGEFTTPEGVSWNDVGLLPTINSPKPRSATTDVQLDAALTYLKDLPAR